MIGAVTSTVVEIIDMAILTEVETFDVVILTVTGAEFEAEMIEKWLSTEVGAIDKVMLMVVVEVMPRGFQSLLAVGVTY